MRNGTLYLNNSGHRWIILENGRRSTITLRTKSGASITRRVKYYESFGNFAVAAISYGGRTIKVLPDQELHDLPKRVARVKVYSFEQLSDKAKEVARSWWRDGGLDYRWWDDVYSWFRGEAKSKGFEVGKIYFSGFWSQGDGAMFEYETNSPMIEVFLAQSKLTPLRKEWFRRWADFISSGKHQGRYYHSGCCEHAHYLKTHGDVLYGSNVDEWLSELAYEFQEFVEESYRDLCDDLYRQLEREYEHLNSDEQVDESIICNDYEFTEDGKRF
jgi:hypothetical protein